MEFHKKLPISGYKTKNELFKAPLIIICAALNQSNGFQIPFGSDLNTAIRLVV
ncbi:hypothetical protein [Oenococcus sicerae]|uniref:hypothetical protein n=1 Tax=Oenococcus sicerae TaxID=2203724 RepID=UPI0039ECB788